MIAPGDTVAVGVSGGPDSTALALALHALAPRLQCRLHLFHLDHGLRADSPKDAEYVRQLGERLGVPCTVLRRDVAAEARQHGNSLEAEGRTIRYRELGRLATQIGATRIATGHHQDDQAETVLLHLLRGTGRKGLTGIPPVRPAGADAPAGCTVIRPLLFTSRQAILAYCHKHGLEPRRDPSNLDPAFLRNRIRHELLPLLTARYNPGASQHLARLAEILRCEEDYLDTQAHQMAAAIGVTFGHDAVQFPAAALATAPPALARRLLRLGAAHLQAHLDFAHTDRICSLARAGKGTGCLDLPHGLRVHIEYGSVHLQRQDRRDQAGSRHLEIPLPVPGTILAYGFRFETATTASAPPGNDPGTVALTPARLPGPLVIRSRRPGDRIHPVGMDGRKKIQDLLVDLKVPRRQRDQVPLLVSGDEVIWVVGYRVDRRFLAAAGEPAILVQVTRP